MVVGALILAVAAFGVGPGAERESDRRWTEILSAADAQADALARARGRVEALYGAGDLPGALRAAVAGLGAAGEDPLLLRRACQLALTLRMADEAEHHSARLSTAVATAELQPTQRAWWHAEARTLQAEAAVLRGHENELVAATRRARAVAAGSLIVVLLGLVGLARRG